MEQMRFEYSRLFFATEFQKNQPQNSLSFVLLVFSSFAAPLAQTILLKCTVLQATNVNINFNQIFGSLNLICDFGKDNKTTKHFFHCQNFMHER